MLYLFGSKIILLRHGFTKGLTQPTHPGTPVPPGWEKNKNKYIFIFLLVCNIPYVKVVSQHHVLLVWRVGADEVLPHLEPDCGDLHDSIGCHPRYCQGGAYQSNGQHS